MILRSLTPGDWPSVRAIYEQGIESGHATFETEVPSWEEWDATRLPQARIVATEGETVVGFAALSPTSKRAVYSGVAEVMVYVAAEHRGRGIGTRLMRRLVEESEAAGLWTLQASIFPENQASVRAHLGVGFREVGRRERIARFHDGRWRDTVVLERRSGLVGTETGPVPG